MRYPDLLSLVVPNSLILITKSDLNPYRGWSQAQRSWSLFKGWYVLYTALFTQKSYGGEEEIVIFDEALSCRLAAY